MAQLRRLEPRSRPHKNLTVMMIDDDEALSQNVYKVLLEREGYRVLIAKSGSIALKLLQDESVPPELILLDCSMPEMDGESFLRELKERMPHILKSSKIIGFTCFEPNSSAFKNIESMGFECVEKPFDIDGILQIVSDSIGLSQDRAYTQFKS